MKIYRKGIQSSVGGKSPEFSFGHTELARLGIRLRSQGKICIGEMNLKASTCTGCNYVMEIMEGKNYGTRNCFIIGILASGGGSNSNSTYRI